MFFMVDTKQASWVFRVARKFFGRLFLWIGDFFLFFNKFSQQGKQQWSKEWRKIAKRRSNVIYHFIHMIFFVVLFKFSVPSTTHALKSMPFHSSAFHGIICGLKLWLFMAEDHLLSILGIIYGRGSFGKIEIFSYRHYFWPLRRRTPLLQCMYKRRLS